jgi:hypothetical protein
LADLISTLRHCGSLRELVLDSVQLRDPLPSKVNELLQDPSKFLGWLPALTVLRLVLYPHNQYHDHYHQFKLLQCLANMVRNGRLEKLFIVPWHSEQGGELSCTLAELIEGGPRSSSQLVPIKQIIDSNRETLRTISTYWEQDPLSPSYELGLIRNPVPGNTKFQLERFTGKLFFLEFLPAEFGYMIPSGPWREVLLRQKYLKELTLDFDDASVLRWGEEEGPVFTAIEDFAAQIIGQNVETLTTLSVICTGKGQAEEFAWDFNGILSRCNRLKSLKLIFNQKQDIYSTRRDTVPKFTGR